MSGAEFQVKGTWFVVARDYVVEQHGEALALEMERYFDADVVDVWSDPSTVRWVPERALGQALMALHQLPCRGDLAAFERVCFECTGRGVDRFFTVLLSMASPDLVLKGVPTMWKLIRRGPARLSVRAVEGGSEVRYENFPYFDDARYRRLTRASLGALVERSRGVTPAVEVRDYGTDHLVAYVAHG